MSRRKPKGMSIVTVTTTNTDRSIRQWLTQADSIDVDNTADYKEMVKKILNEKLIKVIVDMQHIEKLPCSSRSTGSRSSADNSAASSDNLTVCIQVFLCLLDELTSTVVTVKIY